MADSDPRKIRPFGQTPDRRNLDSEEDPLVELARIVSEDSGSYTPRADRQRPRRDDPIDRSAYSADLESELLQELESSFSRGASANPGSRAAPSAPARPPQGVAGSPPADDADDLLRSIEKQLGDFERRTQAPRAAPARAPVEPIAPNRDRQGGQRADRPYEQDPGAAEEQPPRRDPRASTGALAREREAADRALAEARERIAAVRAPERSAPQPRTGRPAPIYAESDDAPEEPVRLPLRRRDPPVDAENDGHFRAAPGFAPGAAAGWNDIGSEETPAAPAATGRQWRSPASEDRDDLRPTFGAYDERDQPRFPADVNDDAEAGSARQLPSGYSEPNFGSDWQEPADVELASRSDEPRVAAAMDPDMDGRYQPERRSSRRGLVAAAAVLGLVVIGGAAAMYMRSGEDVPAGPPPVIAAPEGEAKVEPPQAQAAAEGETVGEAVYDRVAGNAPPAQEQVVDGAEEPREISRIVLPPPQEAADEGGLARPVGDVDAGGAQVAAAAAEDIGPRRVRTYLVRPDGTIAETSAAPAEAPAAPAQEQQVAAVATEAPEPMVPVRVATTDIDGTGQPQAVQPEPGPGAADPAAPAVGPAPDTAAATEAAALEGAQEPPAPAADPLAAPPAEDAPAATPPAQTAAPPELPAAAPEQTAAAPAPAPPPGTADGYVVQISSQRSMAEAQSSWQSASSRFPSVLGNLEPNIQQADLGAKGTYYRVRVGPWGTRAEAVQVCESLRAAGGDCIVTR